MEFGVSGEFFAWGGHLNFVVFGVCPYFLLARYWKLAFGQFLDFGA